MYVRFPRLPLDVLASLPKNDYPVLNTRLFVECWLSYALDKSLTSMRDLFKWLNHTDFSVQISTFSKASSHRSQQIFQQIYQQLSMVLEQKKLVNKYAICPIDSTTISLASKLLWTLGYHSFKLFSSLNLQTGATEENLVVFGFSHDYKYGKSMIDSLPDKSVGVMDRGFASLKFLQNTVDSNKYFVLRIGNKYKLEFAPESERVLIGTGKKKGLYRVIQFCGLETKVEYRLVTNLPQMGEGAISDEEVMEIYRCRWEIQLLWKFLKMHLKLAHLITKNINGIAIQI